MGAQPMLDVIHYSTIEKLRDASEIKIRSFGAADRPEFEAAANRIGALSFYRRFFTVKRSFSEQNETSS